MTKTLLMVINSKRQMLEDEQGGILSFPEVAELMNRRYMTDKRLGCTEPNSLHGLHD